MCNTQLTYTTFLFSGQIRIFWLQVRAKFKQSSEIKIIYYFTKLKIPEVIPAIRKKNELVTHWINFSI